MPQVRSVTYRYHMEISAASHSEKYVSNLLRDVLPDQAFEVLWLHLGMYNLVGPGDLQNFNLAKNITPLTTAPIEILTTTHGHVWVVQEVHTLAENVLQTWHYQLVFEVPLDFDTDDQLNIEMFCYNTGTAKYIADWALTIGYRVR